MSKVPKEISLHDLNYDELSALVSQKGGQRALSRETGVPRTTIQWLLNKAYEAKFAHRPAPSTERIEVKEGVKRFILTSAQDNTRLHDGFMDSLEAYRDWLRTDAPCEIMIAGFTYNKRLFEDNRVDASQFPERAYEHMSNKRYRLGDVIEWCAEMNTLPTAQNPLTGFETYTRQRWGIFPHAKVQLQSVPTMKHDPAKIIMTTGACTYPNYVQKRAGIKASFHHVIGAVLVEIASDGTFFARHLLAEEDGSFYDLDRRITASGVSEHHRVEAINHGDLHVAQIDPDIALATWGYYPVTDADGKRKWVTSLNAPTLINTLMPRYQLFHDTLDFQARNHHNLKDPHHMFRLFVNGVDSVESEIQEAAQFVENTRRPWCKTVMVESNHDLALKTWLKNTDWKTDPLNARFYLSASLKVLDAIQRRDNDFSIFESVMRDLANLDGVIFLRQDESFRVLGIEKGMHGHLGANGARGAPRQFTKAGPKATTGHTHSCGIIDGIYTAGTKSLLDLGYNLGLSSWTHSDVITLPNGKRQIITWSNNRWRL